MLNSVQLREREFHDALSSGARTTSLPPRAPDILEQEILDRAGTLTGVRVLELGCGVGDLTLQLLARGAVVTAIDLSPGMVELAKARAQRFVPGCEADFLAAAIEETDLMPQSFDLVVGKWILHHADVRRAADEVYRVLRDGGRAVFVENSGLNPVLGFSRKYLAGRWGIPKYGTDDEHPLTNEDYRYFSNRFSKVRIVYPDFYFFQLFDRQVLRFKHPQASRLFRSLDSAVWVKAGFLRKYSYHAVLEIER